LHIVPRDRAGLADPRGINERRYRNRGDANQGAQGGRRRGIVGCHSHGDASRRHAVAVGNGAGDLADRDERVAGRLERSEMFPKRVGARSTDGECRNRNAEVCDEGAARLSRVGGLAGAPAPTILRNERANAQPDRGGESAREERAVQYGASARHRLRAGGDA
jgi:hypothetical protein